MTDVNYTHHREHFIICVITESQYCTSEINITLHVDYTSVKKEENKIT